MFSSQLCEKTLYQLAQKSPQLQVFSIAETRYCRSVLAARLGAGTRRVLLAGAFHANEWITALVLLKFCRELLAAPPEAQVCLVPLVNPDGADLVTGALDPDSDQYRSAAAIAARYPAIPFPSGWKANGVGVDLNLNFPAGFARAVQIKQSLGFTGPAPCNWPGIAPLTQPETRGLAELTRRFDPHLVLALHTQGQEIYWRYGSFCDEAAESLGRRMADASGYRLCSPPPISSYAGYKDWFISRFDRPGYTVEAGLGTNPLPCAQFPAIYQSLRPVLQLAVSGGQYRGS